ncbi:putative methyltransferase-domain-containing protein [Polychytrium aggregatum]|uniref:putative methyltransferase-domain-containing protein n=1 Tax=Polychytrium aggregatum TaxID=110093 RepID=UPI0022FDD550|nr:putative methyltransferase-domain-containing protein [Polychytrium aggregatum]KAI9208093.1 putative methyltransferase-domain-containing protein [Polychytrium aggregatum]
MDTGGAKDKAFLKEPKLFVLDSGSHKPEETDAERFRKAAPKSAHKPVAVGRAQITAIPTAVYNVSLSSVSLAVHEDSGAWNTGIAGKVWPSAHVLSEYFEWRFLENASSALDLPRTVLELGSGTGLSGMCLAKIFNSIDHRSAAPPTVMITDLEEAVPLMERNIMENFRDGDWVVPVARALCWGDEDDCRAVSTELVDSRNTIASARADATLAANDIDLIFGSDVVYWPHLFDLLIETLVAMASLRTEVILACRQRELSKEIAFWSKLGKYFHLSPILEWSRYWSEYKNEGFFLLRINKREVPLETDYSDEFEAMLLMWSTVDD